ncbi:hypothetical protein ASF58_13130 [Methylobacterium sp. Leaf125]|uniref:acyltransferase family protein n=1 Tax=Methylobacterium sp. Leaf125 TaxID=1736265 RepID=UPI0006F240B6|nr:acyltransferase family protein [Methylobacterium sp. Leaf125]KQQ26317.1 hypothetical protein ASF58_13130 [Methylobacterium sp. Leaf125]
MAGPRPTQDSAAQYEMFFYALFAVSLAFPRRKGVAHRTSAFGALALLPSRLPHPVSSSPILTFQTQKIVWMIFLGALLSEIDGRTGGLTHPSRPFTAVVACLVRVVAGQARLVETRALDSELLAMIGAGIIVAVALLFAGPRRPSDRVSQTTSLLGDASSSIYLVHGFILTALKHAWDRLGAWPSGWMPSLAASRLACSVGGGAISWFNEKPILIRLRSLTARVPSPAGSLAPARLIER